MQATPGAVSGVPRAWLRLEGLAVLTFALFLYYSTAFRDTHIGAIGRSRWPRAGKANRP